MDLDDELRGAVRALRVGPKGVTPFHWELEFPEVFRVSNSGYKERGFDAFVGNPPFVGGKFISGRLSDSYLQFLRQYFEETGGQADLVAYFFRGCFDLLRATGCMGLVATNTIAQGDTRSSGLRWICGHGGEIYFAQKRIAWPGAAAVVVSIVCIRKGKNSNSSDLILLDGRSVERITAYLFYEGTSENPHSLAANSELSFKGMEPYGHGFLFDDLDPKASPVSLINELVTGHPANASLIHPYIGGEEILNSPTQQHRRYAINFGEMSLEEAEQFPDLLSIVRAKVLPERKTKASDVAAWPWWKYWRTRGELQRKTASMKRILAHPFTTANLAFAFLPTSTIVASPHVVIALEEFASFAVLQSRIHEVWARFFSSSMKDDLRYTPSDCFETFPFPVKWRSSEPLQAAGSEYYEYRAALMMSTDTGLTEIYNRFHKKSELVPEIAALRELHSKLDRAVLDAYGWTDLKPRSDFILDYEDGENDEESASDNERKRPWRYRWIDEDRDAILARLLDLNRTRAEQEAQSVPVASAIKTAGKRGRKSNKSAPVASPNLFEVQEPTE